MNSICPRRLLACILYIKGDQSALYMDYMEGLEQLSGSLDIDSTHTSPVEDILPCVCAGCGEHLGECVMGAIRHVCPRCVQSKWENRILRFYWVSLMAKKLKCSQSVLESHLALAISYCREPTRTKERYGNLIAATTIS